MTTTKKRGHAGIRVRHSRACAGDGRCTCKPGPSYAAWAYSAREERKGRKTFPTRAAATAWRADATTALAKGTMKAAPTVTVREAATAWLAGARDGSIRNRSGDRYKPSTIRGYDAALQARILPEVGGAKLSAVTRASVQDLADRWLAAGLDPSTIRNSLMPLRVIFRRAVSRGEVAVNPCTGIELPAVRGKRDRIAAPDEAARLLDALPVGDRGLWATAMYAGLRAGELMALDWSAVDLAAGLIHVERAYDPKEGEFIDPKSQAGTRRVPIAAVLRDHLIEHKMATRGEGLVFGRDGVAPFDQSSVRARALKAWEKPDPALEPITLHECRHTFASLMIAAGVNAKALSVYMGHASVTITMDRYGHLFPGNEDEAAGLLDAFLARADTAARLAQVEA